MPPAPPVVPEAFAPFRAIRLVEPNEEVNVAGAPSAELGRTILNVSLSSPPVFSRVIIEQPPPPPPAPLAEVFALEPAPPGPNK